MGEVQKIRANLTSDGFICTDAHGNTLTAAGKGIRASDLLLMGVAGCSGGNFRSQIAKAGYTVSKMEISVQGVRTEGRSRHLAETKVHYTIECTGLTQEKAAECLKAAEEVCFVIQSICGIKNLTFTLNP